MDRETHLYDDIIHMPHHISKTRVQMPIHDRAAQFSSFAALVGFDSIIEETERFTAARVELDEEAIAILDEKLNIIARNIHLRPAVKVVYFLPDERKEGGSYVTYTGKVKRIDAFLRTAAFTDGTKIPIEDIYSIDSELFKEFLDED